MGKKAMSVFEYNFFATKFQELKTSTEADKEERLNKLFDSMEQGLTFIGASAIEDKL
jgi:magnesium-transporting ATPase (P-type)